MCMLEPKLAIMEVVSDIVVVDKLATTVQEQRMFELRHPNQITHLASSLLVVEEVPGVFVREPMEVMVDLSE